MPEERAITSNATADLITSTVWVDNEELSSNYQVLGISVEKELNRIPWAKIVLLDGDPASRDFAVSNEELFVPGKEIEIKAGYNSNYETIFKGIVIRHNLQIRRNNAQLIIECKDKAIKLTVGRKSKYFYENKDSDIFEEIVGEAGLDMEIESTNVVHNEMVQYRVTDWDFCITRAQANGKVCVVNNGRFAVIAPDVEQAEVLTLTYGENILDFDAEIDARNQFNSVSSFAWDVANQQIVEKEADVSEPELNGNLSTSDLASVIDLEKNELKDGSGYTDDALQEWANAKSLFNKLSKIRGRVKFQGNAQVKPGTTIELAGVGDRFNGKVYVSAVRHQITEGNWTVDAQFGINPEWFSESVDINEPQAAGLMGAVNGLQLAKVTQLHDDPDGEQRVMVRLPIINNNEQGVWARIATPDAGDNRGMFFRPEIDDEVIVGFLNGNPNHPIILGMLNSSALPAPIEPTEDNHEKGLVTRSEMKFVFDDDKKSVVLETPAGKKITVDEDAGIIQLEDENSNRVTLNTDGITIDSSADVTITASGDVSIEGTNVSLKANAEFTAEGSAGTSISSSAITEVKGSMVNIN